MPEHELRARRQATVQAHMDAEARHDFQAALETFHRPRYEVVPGGEVWDGPRAVLDFWAESDVAFPDYRFEHTVIRHADDSVVVETDFVGTHLGPWRGLPPTGLVVRYRMCNIFEFEGPELVCERLHFDRLHILIQLGIARDPASRFGAAVTLISHPGAVVRLLAHRLGLG